MSKNEIIRGYREVSVTHLGEMEADLHFYVHEKTGAEVCWLERDSENKTFAVAFQTLPSDDTGVFHILEHSVLCGSRKYPVKEPFVELLKGSLNTFLNAMTFPDKTVYPVSSRSDADFRNLMDIYLDAVFFPRLHSESNIFRQEGWHYEVDGEGKLKVVGVVHGEMKGAFSSVDEVIMTRLLSMLYPSNPYRFCSGGDPEHIPELTYEAFRENHRRYYHPSQARIFLDGTMDIAERLEYMDENYLSLFEKREKDYVLEEERVRSNVSGKAYYEISKGEDRKGKSHYAQGKIVCSWSDAEKVTAFSVLSDYLTSSNTAPFSRKVLERGLAQDSGIGFMDGTFQPCYFLELRNVEEEKLDGMRDEVMAIFREIGEEGIDPDELTACFNRLSFRTLEPREPYGVGLAINCYKSWMYGGDPSLYVNMAPIFTELRKKLSTSYFTDLYRECFLDEEGIVSLSVIPSDTLGEEREEKERKKLDAVLASWSEEEKERNRKETEALSLWQQTPDSPEALSSIPRLSKDELPVEPGWTEIREESVDGVKVLRPQVVSSGINYINMYFAIPSSYGDKLSSISLLTALLSSLPTKNYTRELIQREIKTNIGSLDFAVVPLGIKSRSDKSTVCHFRVSMSVLEENAGKAVELLREVLGNTDFSDGDAIREIVMQCRLNMEQNLIASGHQFGFMHALSTQSAAFKASEQIGGYGYVSYLRELAGDFSLDKVVPVLSSFCASLREMPLVVSVSGNISPCVIPELVKGFKGGEAEPTVTLSETKSVSDSILIPAQVSFAVRGSNIYSLGYEYNGAYALAARILSLSYLWNNVRVQGGAYGAGLNYGGAGDIFSFSFRDPNPGRTLGVYSGAADFLRDFCAAREDYSSLLIGVISDSEPQMAPKAESRNAAERYIAGFDREMRRKGRRELLGATYDDILAFASILDLVEEKGSTTVVGSSSLLDGCGRCGENRLS